MALAVFEGEFSQQENLDKLIRLQDLAAEQVTSGGLDRALCLFAVPGNPRVLLSEDLRTEFRKNRSGPAGPLPTF